MAAARGTALLSGYVDLLAERDGRLVVLDFKTDAPPEGEVLASHPAYVEQVRSYQRMLVELGLAAEGQVRGRAALHGGRAGAVGVAAAAQGGSFTPSHFTTRLRATATSPVPLTMARPSSNSVSSLGGARSRTR